VLYAVLLGHVLEGNRVFTAFVAEPTAKSWLIWSWEAQKRAFLARCLAFSIVHGVLELFVLTA